MGTADIRRAVDKGLVGTATCSSCTMAYQKGEESGQLLTLVIHHGNTVETVTRLIPYGVSITDRAQQIGTEIAAQIEGA